MVKKILGMCTNITHDARDDVRQWFLFHLIIARRRYRELAFTPLKKRQHFHSIFK